MSGDFKAMSGTDFKQSIVGTRPRHVPSKEPKHRSSSLFEPERHEPPYTTTGKWFTVPKFGSAGSGGAEYEPLPEAHD